MNGPDIEPHTSGTLKIASVLNNANLLHVTAIDAYGSELFTWTYNLVNVALPVWPSKVRRLPIPALPSSLRFRLLTRSLLSVMPTDSLKG